MPNTSDKRIVKIEKVETPESVCERYPTTPTIEQLVLSTRQKISDILHRRDKRLLVVMGPCSIHDVDAAKEYCERLLACRKAYADRLEIIMRVYFEKPRTTVGWKGLINDPNLDESFDLNKGLGLARELLVSLNAMGMPAGTEFLDIVTGQYYADLISWGAIGARTTESQIHRELASGLSCPVGFKNGTDGNIKIAVDAIKSSSNPHIFLSPTAEGTMAIYRTTGNDDAHLILRGGKEPNYDQESVQQCADIMAADNISPGLVIDLSHANSRKQYAEQVNVGHDIAGQIAAGNRDIVGVMVESHLVAGKQSVKPGEPLVYGQSITDGCLGWEESAKLLEYLAEKVDKRFSA